MNSDEIVQELGNEFYEVKKLLSGGFCAYSIEDRALGETFNGALQNLLNIVKEKRAKVEKENYG